MVESLIFIGARAEAGEEKKPGDGQNWTALQHWLEGTKRIPVSLRISSFYLEWSWSHKSDLLRGSSSNKYFPAQAKKGGSRRLRLHNTDENNFFLLKQRHTEYII